MKNYVCLCLLLCTGMTLYAQKSHKINGRVFDKNNRQPLANVLVYDNQDSVFSNAKGQFSINMAKSAKVHFYYPGFLSYTFVPGSPSGVVKVFLQHKTTSLANVQVNSYGVNSAVLNNPASVQVLTNTDLKRQGDNLAAALNQVAGVQMQERTPGDYRLSVRGSVLQSPWGIRDVKMYWNDIPITTPDNAAPRILPFSSGQMSSVTILKGPGGALYGAGLGGVILFKSKKSFQNQNELSLGFTGGSFGLFRMNAGYQLSEKKFNLSVNYNRLRYDGYRENGWSNQDNISIYANVFPSANRVFSVFVSHSNGSLGLSGAVDSLFAAETPRQALPFAKANKTSVKNYDLTMFGIEQKVYFGHHFSNATAIFGGMHYLDHPHGNSAAYAQYLKQSSFHYGLRTTFNWKPYLGAVKSDFSIGTEWQWEHEQSNNFALINNQPGTWAETGDFETGDVLMERSAMIFGRSTFYLPYHFLLTFGVSYNLLQYRIEEMQAATGGNIPYSGLVRFQPALMPRLALVKTFWQKKLALRGSVSYGFSPPSVVESRLGDGSFNTNLKPEKGVNFELGIRTALLDKRLNFDLSVYQMNMTNMLIPQTDNGGNTYYQNAGATRQKGVELFAYYQAVPETTNGFFTQVRPWFALTLNDYHFLDYRLTQVDANRDVVHFNYDGNKITGVTPTFLSGGVDVTTRSGFYLYPVIHWYGKTPINDANTYYQQSYTLLSVKLGYQRLITHRLLLDIAVGGDNLLNTRYSSMIQFNADKNSSVLNPKFYNPSPTRNFYGSVSLKYNLSK